MSEAGIHKHKQDGKWESHVPSGLTRKREGRSSGPQKTECFFAFVCTWVLRLFVCLVSLIMWLLLRTNVYGCICGGKEWCIWADLCRRFVQRAFHSLCALLTRRSEMMRYKSVCVWLCVFMCAHLYSQCAEKQGIKGMFLKLKKKNTLFSNRLYLYCFLPTPASECLLQYVKNVFNIFVFNMYSELFTCLHLSETAPGSVLTKTMKWGW